MRALGLRDQSYGWYAIARPQVESSADRSCQLKKPIPFDQVESSKWLLDPKTDLTEYATRAFHAEKVGDVVLTTEHRHLHVILELNPPSTPFMRLF